MADTKRDIYTTITHKILGQSSEGVGKKKGQAWDRHWDRHMPVPFLYPFLPLTHLPVRR